MSSSTDDDIGTLLDIISYQLDKDEARKLLAISGKNLEAAVQKFFDTDSQTLRKLLRDSESTWDETAFGAGRYGDNDSNLPTFNIDYAPGYENYPHSAGQSRAPTRPPSRTSVRSTLSTHAGDAPMQSIEGPQESGYIGGSGVAFGPATRASYDASQWAMVPTATEVIADSIPSQRQRQPGQPAILKPSSNFNYLPTLIPILHSIPQFRNALLCPGVTQRDYWMGEDWWKGSASPPARIIDTTKGLAEILGLEILYESQRLMAFLDKTERIYGSVNCLLDSDAWKEPPASELELEDPDDDLVKFLLLWGFAFQAQVPNADLNGALRTVVRVGDKQVENYVLDGNVTRDTSRVGLSVYDVLDDTLFATANESAHIVDISNVLILRLASTTTTKSDLGCRVPATLYADRYMEKNQHVIESMYRDLRKYEEQLSDLSAQTERLKYHTPQKKGAKKVESLKLLQTTMKAFQPVEDSTDDVTGDAAILVQLQNLYQGIEEKLAALDRETQQIQKTRDSISNRFKPIIDDGVDEAADTIDTEYPDGQSPQDAMHHPYRLYGVATRRDVVYLLHPDIDSNVPHAKQWWRMQYDTESANPTIMRDRLTLQDVLERATSESASVLLVYANDQATSSEPLPLSEPLTQFAKKDNLNFFEELQGATAGWENYEDFGDVAQDGWNSKPPEYTDDGWRDSTVKEWHNHGRNDSNISSATLTPNTDIDDDDGPVMQEMVDIGTGAVTGTTMSSASSETIGGDTATADRVELQAEGRLIDVDMEDQQTQPPTQRVEILERKGG